MSDEICSGAGFGTYEEQDKILIGMSGGVDSAVCARILREQGFDVQGVVLRFSPAHDGAVEAARQAASQLGIPLIVEDCSASFEENVVAPFCESYCRGETPSPCVLCNPAVKFRVLCGVADRLGIRYIATGHYARVEENGGIYYVSKAESAARDQSYMLYALGQDVLARLCLPLGEFEKDDIRAMAAESGLSCADAPDSQEICFIPDGDYAAFIAARGLSDKQGRFIGPDGEDLGAHKGVSNYTVGQRKGLGIAYGEPVFVKRILPGGDVELARGGSEFFSGIRVRDAVRTDGAAFENGERFEVKIRSRAVPAPCTVADVSGDGFTLLFDEPQRAPAPGQSAVLYDGNRIAGGGVISEMID